MKWGNRLRERKTERWDAPLVWWVRQGEAEKKIKELKQRIKELEANDKLERENNSLIRRLEMLRDDWLKYNYGEFATIQRCARALNRLIKEASNE